MFEYAFLGTLDIGYLAGFIVESGSSDLSPVSFNVCKSVVADALNSFVTVVIVNVALTYFQVCTLRGKQVKENLTPEIHPSLINFEF